MVCLLGAGEFSLEVTKPDDLPQKYFLSLCFSETSLLTSKDNLFHAFDTPHLLIITATDNIHEDLTPELNFVKESMLQIDILTVVGHEHPELMSMTHFGHFYAGDYLLYLLTYTVYCSFSDEISHLAVNLFEKYVNIFFGNNYLYVF